MWFELLKDNQEKVITSYPPMMEKVPEGIPSSIGKAFQEAINCMQLEAWNGSLSMSRRTLQEALNDMIGSLDSIEEEAKKKLVKSDLPTQLQALVDAHRITPDLKDWADQARIGGKLAAHGTGGDEWGEPDKEWGDQEDAQTVIEFLQSFLEYSFVMKQRLANRRGPEEREGAASEAT